MRSDPAEPDSPIALGHTARAVLDGTAVDWDGLTSTADQETRGLIAELRVLETIAGLHRAEPPAPTQTPASPRLGTWAHLDLLERVGAGAFGEVYRAWDTRLDREVALKLLPAGAATGATPLIEEGRLLARVRHPNVATIYGAELIGDRIGLWMEFVRGRTLEDLLRSGREFTISEIVEIGIELSAAVTAVHAAGVLHRDIKTQNVMQADDGRVVLMDFGTGHDQSVRSIDAAGTPLYLAPEIFNGQHATVQSDVYSVGVVLYRLLTGAYPVTATSLSELRRGHETRARADLASLRPDVPQTIVRILDRTIAADPAQRYSSCAELGAALAGWKGGRTNTWPRWLLVAAGSGLAVWLGWMAWARSDAAHGGASGASVAAIDRPVILVRPFRNLSREPDSEFIADGLTYELIRSFAIIKGLEVRSAASSFATRDREQSLASIGQSLGVNLVLEGSVSESDGALRVQAQLSKVAGDSPIWTGKFDRPRRNVLAIQDEISRAVVNELRLTLGGGQRRYDLDPETIALYLKARTLANRKGIEAPEAAAALFEQVVVRDPSFAPAHAGLADAYALMSMSLPDVLGMQHQRALALMRASAEKAIALDPLLAEAHAAIGIVRSREFAWDQATQSFGRALELNPGLTHVYTAYSLTTLVPLGRFDEAEAILADAERHDPLSLDVKREQAAVKLVRGQYDDAIRLFEEIRQVDSGFPFTELLLARARSLAGRLDETLPFWDSVSGQLGYQHWMAYAYVAAGRRAEIERLVAKPQVAYRRVLFYTALGDRTRALDALAEAAVEAPHRTVRLLQYPELASLRDDARFEAVRQQFHLP